MKCFSSSGFSSDTESGTVKLLSSEVVPIFTQIEVKILLLRTATP